MIIEQFQHKVKSHFQGVTMRVAEDKNAPVDRGHGLALDQGTHPTCSIRPLFQQQYTLLRRFGHVAIGFGKTPPTCAAARRGGTLLTPAPRLTQKSWQSHPPQTGDRAQLRRYGER